jgi:flagellar protein FliO/FliZ
VFPIRITHHPSLLKESFVIDFWESLLRTLSALAVVLVLMAAATMAVRRLLGRRLGTPGRQALVRVVASGYIAPRKTISLVSVAGEYLIVGATATDLVPLGRVGDSGKVRELLASTAPDSSPAAPSIPQSVFAPWLQCLPANVFQRRKGQGEGEP